MVYFIRAGERGPIKIGFTQGSPQFRMACLQAGNPEMLYLLGVVEGSLGDEEALHARFGSLRLRGEWFAPGDDLVAFIEANAREWEDPIASRPRRCELPLMTSLQFWCDSRERFEVERLACEEGTSVARLADTALRLRHGEDGAPPHEFLPGDPPKELLSPTKPRERLVFRTTWDWLRWVDGIPEPPRESRPVTGRGRIVLSAILD